MVEDQRGLLGSVLHAVGPDSDADVPVTFAEDVPWSLFAFVHGEDDQDCLSGEESTFRSAARWRSARIASATEAS